MKKDNKQALFETDPIPKAVAVLTIPTIAACLVMMLYSLADTFFVGLLNDPYETSAVTLAAPVLLAFNAVNNLFGTGCSSVMSRALGAKDYDKVRRTSSIGFYFAIICGALFSLLALIFKNGLMQLLGTDAENLRQTSNYLFWTVILGAVPSILNVVMGNLVRAEGCALHASIGTMSGCLLNIVLDPIFILPWGLNLGAAGAGCATFISNCVACLYLIILTLIKRGRTYVCLAPASFRPERSLMKDICAVGIPASVQNLLNVTGMTILNNCTAAYGSEAVSAMGISHKLSLVPLYVSMGMGQGIMPLVGYNYSSGNRKRMKSAIRFTEVFAIIFMLFAAAAFYFLAAPIIRLFMENALIVAYGSTFLRAFSLAMPFLAMDFLAVGIFQACGLGRRSLIFAIMRKIVLEIPAMLILNRLFQANGIAWSQLCAELILGIAGFLCLEKIMNTGNEGALRR